MEKSQKDEFCEVSKSHRCCMPNNLDGEPVSETLVFQVLPLISNLFLSNEYISKMHAIVESIASSFMRTDAQRATKN